MECYFSPKSVFSSVSKKVITKLNKGCIKQSLVRLLSQALGDIQSWYCYGTPTFNL